MEDKNDFDSIAEQLGDCITLLGSSAHMVTDDLSDSTTITKEGLINMTIKLARLQRWVQGLAEGQRMYSDKEI